MEKPLNAAQALAFSFGLGQHIPKPFRGGTPARPKRRSQASKQRMRDLMAVRFAAGIAAAQPLKHMHAAARARFQLRQHVDGSAALAA